MKIVRVRIYGDKPHFINHVFGEHHPGFGFETQMQRHSSVTRYLRCHSIPRVTRCLTLPTSFPGPFPLGKGPGNEVLVTLHSHHSHQHLIWTYPKRWHEPNFDVSPYVAFSLVRSTHTRRNKLVQQRDNKMSVTIVQTRKGRQLRKLNVIKSRRSS